MSSRCHQESPKNCDWRPCSLITLGCRITPHTDKMNELSMAFTSLYNIPQHRCVLAMCCLTCMALMLVCFRCPSPKQGLAACGSLSIYQYQYLSIFVLIFQSAAHRWVPIKACFSRESHSEQSVEIQSQADWVSRQQKQHPPSNCRCLTILANSSEDHAEDSLLVVDPGCDNCAWLNSIYSLSHPFSSLM